MIYRPALSVLLLVGCFLTPLTAAEKKFRFPERKLGDKAELRYVNGLPVLIVEGCPEEIGTAIGKLALKPASRILDYPKDVMKEMSVSWLWSTVLRTGKSMYDRFPERFQTELEAVMKSADAPREQVIAGNTLFDIKKIVLCSALLVDGERSSTGGPLFGRNLDYPSLGYVQNYSLVTIYRQKGKHTFASIGFPGLAGCLSGMNDAGLCVAVHETFSPRKGEGRFNPKGLPYALCYRILLEECSTIEEAKKKLESLPRTTLNALSIADRNGVAVLEITPKSVMIRRGREGVCACTNHYCTDIKADVQVNMGASFRRFDFLEETRKLKRKVEVNDIFKRLAAIASENYTLHTMVFEPKTLKLHLTMGSLPSTREPLKTLDMAKLFQKKLSEQRTQK